MERIEMSTKDANKAIVIGQILEKKLSQKEAAIRLKLSTRQIRRLTRRVQLQGPLAVVHKGKGRSSYRKISDTMRHKILGLLEEKYPDFGPTLAAEKLYEIEGIKISNEYLRKLMISSGKWKAKQKRIVIHQQRNRRAQYGELIQIDGSHHAWFEDRAPKCVALVFVDDATSRLQKVYFCSSENLHNYFFAMHEYVQQYGCPLETYTDRHSVFTINHMRGGEKKGQTQFARMLYDLNITQNLANSPQAKGRVERMNRVLQDRLVKEFRIANISSINEANAFMNKYITDYNKKFAKPATLEADRHRELTSEQKGNLEYIFAIQDNRKVSKALTVQYENAVYAISQVRAIRTLRKRGVKVYELLNGDVKMFSDNRELAINILEYTQKDRKDISRKELDTKLDHYLHMATRITNDTNNINNQPFC